MSNGWKFDNARLKPNGDIVYEILVIRLFSHFEKKALKVFFRLGEKKLALWIGGGEGGGG